MPERTPISVLIDAHPGYYSRMVQKSSIKTVVILVAIGTITWLIAGMVAITLDYDSKYVWTCVAGAALGAWGIRYSKRRAARSGI